MDMPALLCFCCNNTACNHCAQVVVALLHLTSSISSVEEAAHVCAYMLCINALAAHPHPPKDRAVDDTARPQHCLCAIVLGADDGKIIDADVAIRLHANAALDLAISCMACTTRGRQSNSSQPVHCCCVLQKPHPVSVVQE